MGLVKTRRLAAMQKQQKAKLTLPKPKPDKRKDQEAAYRRHVYGMISG